MEHIVTPSDLVVSDQFPTKEVQTYGKKGVETHKKKDLVTLEGCFVFRWKCL